MKKYGTLLAAIMILSSCENDSNKEESPELVVNENAATFKEIGSITIGGRSGRNKCV
jgi:PBP1b-binding outer membrane lipoprotein LpoB